jgi:hypothetical protein
VSTFTSLLPVSAPATGTSQALAKTTAHHTIMVVVDGPARTCDVVLQGSHDGTNWTDIARVNSPTGGLATTQATAHLMGYVRARLATLDPADGSVLVSASIASDDGA